MRGADVLGHVTLAVLAGGQGTRMGRPKGELELGGRPILEVLLAQFAWPGPTRLITAPGRERPPGWQRFDRELVDPAAGLGPLRGLLTAMEDLHTTMLIVATVDMPGIAREHLEWLAGRLHAEPGLAGVMCIARSGDDARPPADARPTRAMQVEPFPIALRARAIDAVRSGMVSGRRSVVGLLGADGFAAVQAPPEWGPNVWTNLNHPADLHRWRPCAG